jgi:hypothetical protein
MERALRTSSPPFGDGTCTGEQSDTLVDGKRTGSDWVTIELREKAYGVPIRCRNASQVA